MTAALAATAPLRGLGQARHGVGHQERARAPPRGQLTLDVPAHACPPPGDGKSRGGRPRGSAPPRAHAGLPERAREAWRGGRGQGAWPGGKHPLTVWPEVEPGVCESPSASLKARRAADNLAVTFPNWVLCSQLFGS